MSIRRPVNPGDPLGIEADTYNAILRSAQAAEAQRFTAGGTSIPAGGWPSVDAIKVRNDTGSDWPAGGVYRLGAAVVDPAVAATTPHARRMPILQGLIPSGPTDKFAICMEITRAGNIGYAATNGVTVAFVDVVDTTHEYATIAPQVQLRSAHYGPVRILHKDAGTGLKTAIVQIMPATNPAPTYVHVRAKTRVAAAGAVPAHWEYTCREVRKSAGSGNVTWAEVAGASNITGVLEDQDRELVVDGTGGFVSQAYCLDRDPSGVYWVTCDQYAGRSTVPVDPQDSPPDADGLLPGLVSTQKQTFGGKKTFRNTVRVTGGNASFYVTGVEDSSATGQAFSMALDTGNTAVGGLIADSGGGTTAASIRVSGTGGDCFLSSGGGLPGHGLFLTGGNVALGHDFSTRAVIGVVAGGSANNNCYVDAPLLLLNGLRVRKPFDSKFLAGASGTISFGITGGATQYIYVQDGMIYGWNTTGTPPVATSF